ncbi:MAG TPA: hypothetical protein VEI81_08615 [Methanoregula sp.]|nr:hypothetical protein [Methanoregula sp.]
MTYGTLGFGFFRDTDRFRQKFLYWHILPSCTELGFRCPGKSADEAVSSFTEGIRIQNGLVFAAAAASVAAGRS